MQPNRNQKDAVLKTLAEEASKYETFTQWILAISARALKLIPKCNEIPAEAMDDVVGLIMYHERAKLAQIAIMEGLNGEIELFTFLKNKANGNTNHTSENGNMGQTDGSSESGR